MNNTERERIVGALKMILGGDASRGIKLQAVCDFLKSDVEHYDWVGFYLVPEGGARELVLDAYAGAATEHARIGFGEGICGQAADRGEPFVVQDVSKETNYLSCSIHVKSEIVVPVMRGGEVIGEIDIDSHQLSPFTDADTELLEEVARIAEPVI